MVSRIDRIYYQQELSYLKQQGKIFAERHPDIAHYLGLSGNDPSLRDPHAERIVEAFAFLMGKLNRFREAQFPEMVQALFQLIYPGYLRGLPSKTLVAFSAQESMIDSPVLVPKGTELYADQLGPNGETYTFTTCWDVHVQPVLLKKVYYDPEAPGDYGISIVLQAHAGVDFSICEWDHFELALTGDPGTALELFLLLSQHLQRVSVKGKGHSVLGVDWPGFENGHDYAEHEAEYPSRLHFIRDYFDDVKRFLFFRVTGLGELLKAEKNLTEIQLDFTFSRPLATGVHFTEEHFGLFCTVAQNLFRCDCEPFQADENSLEYALTKDSEREDLEVVRVVDVIASQDRMIHPVRPYYHFSRDDSEQERQLFYALRRDMAPEQGWETWLRLIDANHQGPGALIGYTISVSVLCSNRHYAQKLEQGRLNRIDTLIPETISVRNISLATRAAWPPLHSRDEWDFLAHLSLDYSELERIDVLKTLLNLYHYAKGDAGNRRIRGINEIRAEKDYIIKQGTCVLGRRFKIDVNGNFFSGPGDVALFAHVFSCYLQSWCPINGFIRLEVFETETGNKYEHVSWG